MVILLLLGLSPIVFGYVTTHMSAGTWENPLQRQRYRLVSAIFAGCLFILTVVGILNNQAKDRDIQAKQTAALLYQQQLRADLLSAQKTLQEKQDQILQQQRRNDALSGYDPAERTIYLCGEPTSRSTVPDRNNKNLSVDLMQYGKVYLTFTMGGVFVGATDGYSRISTKALRDALPCFFTKLPPARPAPHYELPKDPDQTPTQKDTGSGGFWVVLVIVGFIIAAFKTKKKQAN